MVHTDHNGSYITIRILETSLHMSKVAYQSKFLYMTVGLVENCEFYLQHFDILCIQPFKAYRLRDAPTV